MATKNYGNKDKIITARLRPEDERALQSLGTLSRKLGKLRRLPTTTEIVRAALQAANRYPDAFVFFIRGDVPAEGDFASPPAAAVSAVTPEQGL